MKRSGPIRRKVPLRANGGKARAEKLPAERRSEIARAGGLALQAQRVASRHASAFHVKPAAVMASNIGAEAPRASKKQGGFDSEAWRRAVTSLACANCDRPGPSQCAHINHRGKGMGLKAPDCWTFPLCPDCHREFDQGKSYTKDQRREVADGWVINTIKELAQRGLIRA